MIGIGYAYLPDGRRLDYDEYLRTPEWEQKRINRCAFDNWQCGLCHEPIRGGRYETHHIFYTHLGNEDIEHDLITLCHSCHTKFHSQWNKNDYWVSNSSPLEHWKDYSLKDTAQLCLDYKEQDYWFGGEYNLCSADTIKGFIDKYCIEHEIMSGVQILETDVLLCFRNLRYEVYLNAVAAGKDLETFLDERFGTKGQKGGNKKRSSARNMVAKHTNASIKRFIKENQNIIIIIDEMKKMEEMKNEQA